MSETHKTACYKTISDSGGTSYRFFCELSGMEVCVTEPVKAVNPVDELMLAWEYGGKKFFNHCNKCGRWVSNAMFNVDTVSCVKCSPIENPPIFCPYCGKQVASDSDVFCRSCGKKLLYKEELQNE